MYQIESESNIAASCAEVWSHLLDFASYPDWNPYYRSLRGQPQVGARLHARMKLAPLLSLPLKPKLVYCEPERYLAWRGCVLGPFVLEGEHYFELQPRGPNQCWLRQGEIFSGITSRALGPLLGALIRPRIIAMNDALRSRAAGKRTASERQLERPLRIQSASARIEN